jgi:hypothetical protein
MDCGLVELADRLRRRSLQTPESPRETQDAGLKSRRYNVKRKVELIE